MPHLSDKVLGLFMLAAVTTAYPLPEDREQPISLEANSASFDQNTGVSVYRGNVVVTQGSMYLAADKATVYFKNSQFVKMEAAGAPTRFRYRPAADRPEIDGIGREVSYDVKAGQVTVSGGARFNQGGDVMTGETIVYDLSQDVVKVEGGKQRIKIILQPSTSN